MGFSVRRLCAVCLLAVSAALLASLPRISDAQARPVTKAKLARAGGDEFRHCRIQPPQKFLKRESFLKGGQLQPAAHRKAVLYRVKHYGNVEGLGLEKHNPVNAFKQAAQTRFMGLPLSVHQKIVPALRCVERRIQKTCNKKGSRYVPRAVGGFRNANTYRGGEISNHVFGTAIDIDPERNPCCGCVDPWPNNPRCANAKSVWEKASLPRCWVDAFERYGFYWLGRDQLEDTMHFEFLGNPDRILP
jgi:hypothetical protein